MADGDIVAVPRENPDNTDQSIESIEQNRDAGGVRLVQSIAKPCLKNDQAPTHSQADVTTSSSQILAANDKRLDAVIAHNGSDTIYLLFGTGTAATATHIPLNPMEKVHLADFTHAGAVQAIAASGTQDIRIVEFHLT